MVNGIILLNAENEKLYELFMRGPLVGTNKLFDASQSLAPILHYSAWFRKALFWIAKCATKPT